MTQLDDGIRFDDLGDGCFAYVQRDGSWGWSNAGLVTGEDVSLLVDTLFDLKLTARMLETMAGVTRGAPIGTVVNTHGNGDHCYGNELVTGAEIISSVAAAHEMAEVPPSVMAMMNRAPGEVGDLMRSFFGDFDFEGITLTLPTRTFEGRLDVEVGGRLVELIEVGPAHTAGDTIAWVPDARTVFTGDILFSRGTPIVWAGPISNWIAACDLMLGLGVETVVPGHGPVTDASGIARAREYLVYVEAEATKRFEAGMDAWEAAQDISLDAFSDLSEAGRLVVNVDNRYRELDPTHVGPDVVERFRRMAAIEHR